MKKGRVEERVERKRWEIICQMRREGVRRGAGPVNSKTDEVEEEEEEQQDHRERQREWEDDGRYVKREDAEEMGEVSLMMRQKKEERMERAARKEQWQGE